MPLGLNNIQAADLFKALGTIGGTMGSPGGTLAGGMGQAAGNLIEAKGLRRTGAQQAQQAQTFQNQLIQALAQNQEGVINDPNDNTLPDKLQLSADGGTISWKNTKPQPAFQGEQQPLEGQQARPNQAVNQGQGQGQVARQTNNVLPQFFQGQSILGPTDMAGLSPEGVISALGREDALRQQRLDGAQMFMTQRNAQQQRQREDEQRLTTSMQRIRESVQKREATATQAKAKVTAAETLAENQRKLATLRADLRKKDIDPLDRRKKELDIQKLEKDLEGKSNGLTLKQSADIERDKIKTNLALDKFSADQLDFLTDPGIDFETKEQVAQSENSRPGANMVYAIDQPIDTAWYDLTAMDQSGAVQGYPIPRGLMFNNQAATGNEIIRRAEMAGMTVPEYLNEIQRRSQ